jgi:hypothetical protein
MRPPGGSAANDRRVEPLDSSTIRWRRGLLTVCAAGFLLWAFSLFQMYAWFGRVGWQSPRPTAVPFHDVAVGIVPGSPAAEAGIKAGDVFDLHRASATERWRIRTRWLADHPLTYVVLRGSTERRITLRPKRWVNQTWFSWYIGALGALIFATLIAWRRPWLVEARLLCLVLIAQVMSSCLNPSAWVTPWAPLDFGAVMLGAVVSDLAVALLIGYTLLFGRPVSTMRKAIAAFAFVFLGFDLLLTWATYAGTWTGAFDLFGGPIGGSANLFSWDSFATDLMVPVAIATAFAAARGRQRSLLVWTTATLVVVNLKAAALNIILALPMSTPSFLIDLLNSIGDIAQFLTPFTIGYALLHRRLLDIGFVLNQAAVFSGVSLIIVGLFMLGEWLIGSWLGRMSHATNLTIGAALVLTLGFSVRVIHSRVERVLDRVFFRKRHDDEMAIRDFAQQAADSGDATTLVRETKATLERHADAEYVTLAMDDGSGRYGSVSESDPAIVALHGRHSALDLKTLSTQLQGEFAYPMIARGQLVGALVLGPKRSGDNYAPDESHAIMQLAHEVGNALRFLTLEKALQDHHLPA